MCVTCSSRYACHVLVLAAAYVHEVCVDEICVSCDVCASGMRLRVGDAYEVIWVQSAYGARGHVFHNTPTHSTRPGCLVFFLVAFERQGPTRLTSRFQTLCCKMMESLFHTRRLKAVPECIRLAFLSFPLPGSWVPYGVPLPAVIMLTMASLYTLAFCF